MLRLKALTQLTVTATFLLIILAFAPLTAKGQSSNLPLNPAADQELRNFLYRFQQNSKKAMSLDLPKRDLGGNAIMNEESPFPEEAVRDGSYMAVRIAERRKMCASVEGQKVCIKDMIASKAGFRTDDKGLDRAENLIEMPPGQIMRNVAQMESNNLLKYQLTTNLPWSDSYWPIISGVTATRYADPGFPKTNWRENHDYVMSHPAWALFMTGASDNLAPSEKYDSLVGDTNYTLTGEQWRRGERATASWEGICDGWSAASIMFPEPIKSIDVTSASGLKIHFFPSDIKAMAALIWSSAPPQVRMVGTTCKTSNPTRDPIGRIKAPECWDTNPGTFHLVTVNQLGILHRPFIMDGVYDVQIWNYPTWMYEYSYFNPQTFQPSGHWRDAIVAADRFYTDKFKPYRSPDTKYVVGISMNATYMIEIQPTHYENQHFSVPRTAHYIYDLELNANKEIIGGEWYSFNHPDFMWTPPRGARAMSIGDSHLIDHPTWDGSQPVPDAYTQVAPTASSLGQPLSVIVEKLVDLSK